MQTAQRQQGAAALQPQPPEPPAAHHLFLMTHTATGLAAGLVLPQPKMAWQGWGQFPPLSPQKSSVQLLDQVAGLVALPRGQ